MGPHLRWRAARGEGAKRSASRPAIGPHLGALRPGPVGCAALSELLALAIACAEKYDTNLSLHNM